MKKIGLRVDVDTWQGTKQGVPALLAVMAAEQIRASFFFSLGPDNMGRHLWRLFKPVFLYKMLRCRALSTYGGSILLAGTFWPGRKIGQKWAAIIRETAVTHEVGLHAWDHYAWQTWAGRWSHQQLTAQIRRGEQCLAQILSDSVTCSAAAGWRADERVLKAKQDFNFRYNSDCRGSGPFRPRLADGSLGTVQIPVTLPTWDEVVGRQVSVAEYNGFIIEQMLAAEGTPVYTLHAEVEGGKGIDQFAALLTAARRAGIAFCPLSDLLPDDLTTLPMGRVVRGTLPGREGWLGYQESLIEE